MKLAVSYILLLTLTFPWVIKVGIIADFVIHQDYIAENFCENRDKPELHCDGTCVFMKKLNLSEEQPQEKRMPVEVMSFEISSFLVHACSSKLPASDLRQILQTLPFYTNLYSHLSQEDIFHPPCQA